MSAEKNPLKLKLRITIKRNNKVKESNNSNNNKRYRNIDNSRSDEELGNKGFKRNKTVDRRVYQSENGALSNIRVNRSFNLSYNRNRGIHTTYLKLPSVNILPRKRLEVSLDTEKQSEIYRKMRSIIKDRSIDQRKRYNNDGCDHIESQNQKVGFFFKKCLI